MTLAELLKAKGIEEGIVNAILEEMKANKIFTASEENLDVRYGKLKTDHDAVIKERDEGKALIAELQKSNKGNEALQQQVSDYEAKIAQLQEQNNELKAEAAMDRALTAAGAKASDLDYLKFQWRKKGEVALDDNGEVKGANDIVAAMKTQFPTQFEAGDGNANGGYKPYGNGGLPKGNGGDSITKEQFRGMTFEERMNLKKTNEALYKQYAKN